MAYITQTQINMLKAVAERLEEITKTHDIDHEEHRFKNDETAVKIQMQSDLSEDIYGLLAIGMDAILRAVQKSRST